MTTYWVKFDYDMQLEFFSPENQNWTSGGPVTLFGTPVYGPSVPPVPYSSYPWGFTNLPYAAYAQGFWTFENDSYKQVITDIVLFDYTIRIEDYFVADSEPDPTILVGPLLTKTVETIAPGPLDSPGSASAQWIDWAWTEITLSGPPPQLFTTGADVVDFNNLNSTQQQAITDGADKYHSLAGNDVVTLPNNSSEALGWDYGQTFNAGQGDDDISGGTGDDTILGGEGNDKINGQDGTDVLAGNEGDDTIDGGAGNDTLSGDSPFVALIPGLEVNAQGNDTIQAGAGDDILFGGGGADKLFGGDGDDSLRGGTGNDMLDGGTGYNAANFSGEGSTYTAYFQTPLNWNVVGPDGTDNAVLINDFKFDNATVTNDQLFQQLVAVEEIAEIKSKIDQLIHTKTNIDALIQLCQQSIDAAKENMSAAELAGNILSLKVVIDDAF